MKEPLVSIVMPMYNSSRYVEESVKSVLSQSFQDWELLVVDDGSSDNSLEIVQRYERLDDRVHLLQNSHPSGRPASPRNLGVKMSRGRFIAFLDSDDVWLPEKLACQLPLFEDAHTAIVYAYYEKMDEQGVRHHRVVKAPKKMTYRGLLRGNVIGNLTGIYDTAKVGKHYFKMIHHEDYPMWLGILKTGFVARCVPQVLAVYRVREESVSSRKWSIVLWQWNIYRKVERFGFFKSLYYYIHYALRAFRKRLI